MLAQECTFDFYPILRVNLCDTGSGGHEDKGMTI